MLEDRAMGAELAGKWILAIDETPGVRRVLQRVERAPRRRPDPDAEPPWMARRRDYLRHAGRGAEIASEGL